MPSYQSLNMALNQQSVALTAAEMHGLISGLLCGGNSDASWQTLVFELTNEGIAFPQAVSLPLRQLYEATRETLESEEFMFQLMIPDGEATSVFERADALAGWVNHFLLGLGMMQPKLAHVKGEVGEAIDDLRNIAKLGYDAGEDQEEMAQSLEEILEYVRVVALICHNEFTHNKPPISENPTLTLH